ncbi:ORF34 [Felid gammaherpesvirus 1]|uniref:ORF34 n=1 Tax=Felid gammaherpesvirus 1 TaxID=2560468 RepID=A0A0M3T9C8_9GAMA|nr:ORF34 [Felis catus gammaherpesvirus 1]ALE14746.1 ORF34 [Felis catus gammaherpesvirus 1]
MFNLTNLMNDGDPTESKKYYSSVGLAMSLCESVPGQFKLIETPINSFVLVTNVMPEDTRPWNSHNSKEIDFSNIHLPRLKKLDELTHWDVHKSSHNTTDPKTNPLDQEPPSHYLVYSSNSWKRAILLDKQEVIKEALDKLALPINWKGLVTEDPYPLIWLLFYGQNSFCSNNECLFFKKFGYRGAILFPPHVYSPSDDSLSFITNVCKYIKFLYGDQFKGEMIQQGSELPFDLNRLIDALAKLKFVCDSGVYISRTCLLCNLYKQNLTRSRISVGNFYGSIILGGCGKKYLAQDIQTERCVDSGDSILCPSYDLTRLLNDLRDPINGPF